MPGGTQEWEHVVDAGEELGPTNAGGGGRARWAVGLGRRGSGAGWNRSRLGLCGLGPAEGDDRGAELGVRGQHAVVAVAVEARGRDEPGDSLEELYGREQEFGTALQVGPGEPVKEPGRPRVMRAQRRAFEPDEFEEIVEMIP